MTSDNNYKYKIEKTRTMYSKAEIINSLKEYSETHGVVTFGVNDYSNWSKRILTPVTIIRTFGSWGKALQAAGLRAKKWNKLEPKEMVTAFKACWREHNSVPSRKQLEKYLELHNYPFTWTSHKNTYGGHLKLVELIVEVQEGRLSESALYRKITKKPGRKPTPLKMRSSVLKRDNYTCVKCGASPQKDKAVTLEVDHIVPGSKEGPTTMENLQTLCFDCNQGKKDREN